MASEPEAHDLPGAREAQRCLQRALLALCEGAYDYEPARNQEALRGARRALSRCIGHLLMLSEDVERGTVLSWVEDLETKVLPPVAGLLRWCERLGRKRS